jgi:predicted peptidase
VFEVKNVIVLLAASIVMFCLSGAALAGVSGYYLTTGVKPVGQRALSISVEYDKSLMETSLERGTYAVSVNANGDGTYVPVPITEIYVSAEADGTSPSRGRFVIVNFDAYDDASDTRYFNDALFLTFKRDVDYKVLQTKPFYFTDGTLQPASDEAIPKKGQKNLIVDDFAQSEFDGGEDGKLKYRLFSPTLKDGEKYPLVLFCHGAGEAGDNNEMHITASIGATVWAKPEVQAKHPSFVLAPQIPQSVYKNSLFWVDGKNERNTMALIKELIATKPIDPDRIYVQGLSMGGYGTWNFIADNPDFFAAAMPICGFFGFDKGFFGPGRNESGMPEVKRPAPAAYSAEELKTILAPVKDLPIRFFHAADDNLVVVENSRNAAAALRELGSKAEYLEFPAGYAGIVSAGNPHNSWEAVYDNMDNADWLFSHTKNKRDKWGERVPYGPPVVF